MGAEGCLRPGRVGRADRLAGRARRAGRGTAARAAPCRDRPCGGQAVRAVPPRAGAGKRRGRRRTGTLRRAVGRGRPVRPTRCHRRHGRSPPPPRAGPERPEAATAPPPERREVAATARRSPPAGWRNGGLPRHRGSGKGSSPALCRVHDPDNRAGLYVETPGRAFRKRPGNGITATDRSVSEDGIA